MRVYALKKAPAMYDAQMRVEDRWFVISAAKAQFSE